MRKSELAEVLGVSIRTVESAVQSGMPKGRQGRAYDFGPDAIVWYYQKKLDAVEGKMATMGEAQRRKAIADAQRAESEARMAELNLAKRRGELIEVTEVLSQWGMLCDALRAKILGIPGQAAHRLVGCKSQRQARAQLEESIRDVLAELRDYHEHQSETS